MAKSFNRYPWNPIRHGYYPQPQVQTHSIKPKVINIPVQFVGTDDRTSKLSPATPPAAASVVPSEEATVSAAATIQRAVRGFLVRKNAGVVRQVAAEVDEIERKLKNDEANIRLDARERLRVNEALMALLLRLDSVRGVRDFRKKVIRRIITLQEIIDSISAIGIAEDRGDSSNEAANESAMDNEKAADQILHLEEETNGGIPAAVESPNRKSDLIAAGDGTISTSGRADDLKDSMGEAAEESSMDREDQTLDLEEETNEAAAEMEMKIQEVEESPKGESNVIPGFEIGRIGLSSPEAEEIPKGDNLVASQWSSLMVAEKEEGEIGVRELMERMAAENERFKEMVAQLCKTSAEQCRLMEGLANRVGHLERVIHRMDRWGKRRGAACSAMSSAK